MMGKKVKLRVWTFLPIMLEPLWSGEIFSTPFRARKGHETCFFYFLTRRRFIKFFWVPRTKRKQKVAGRQQLLPHEQFQHVSYNYYMSFLNSTSFRNSRIQRVQLFPPPVETSQFLGPSRIQYVAINISRSTSIRGSQLYMSRGVIQVLQHT